MNEIKSPELSFDLETAFFILTKLREYAAKEGVSDPDSGSNPTDDHEIDVLQDTPGDATREELIASISALNADAQAELLALMWIGRGDFAPSEWATARARAAEVEHKHVARYLAETPLASDYLEEALTQYGYDMSAYQQAHL